MRCSKCGSDSPAGKKFCGDCGAPLANKCPKCGAENPPSKSFCHDCGTALAHRTVLLMRDSGATEQAEACFRTALRLAQVQEARWWELRIAASRARLLRDTRRRDEARSMLAEIYNWFTEGFDLPDLQEAKALVDELSE